MSDGDNNHLQNQHQHRRVASLALKNLKVISALGRGAKGVVFLVRSENGESLALKAILRDSIGKNHHKNSSGDDDDAAARRQADEYRRTCFERNVLASFQHPLLPKLHGELSTDKIIGYAIDYCPGRDLNSLRKKQTEKMFSDDIIRFYAAEIVLALEYLHGLGIVYRDLKPENVMIQENGHLMLVDFDLSTKLSAKTPETHRIGESTRNSRSMKDGNKKKKNKRFLRYLSFCKSGISESDSVHPVELSSDSGSHGESDSVEKSKSFVGTEEYVAPEILLGDGHDFSVDWWCFGVLLYEMLYGTTPFRGSNRKETFYRILVKEPDLVGEPTPLRDLIRKLLEKDPQKRISGEDIKGHDFFKDIDWAHILAIPRPPFIPGAEDIEGNKEIDVESFVQGVFKVGIDGDEKVENKKNSENKNNDNEEKKNKGVWVEGLSNPHTQNENFLMF